ncbi:acyl-CoA synthetase (AMP-forming)/AMP-acid ligase II [Knoellia remsis]|uniref:Acyl-CoA synthetase (AMP-forming)/AMP-acid ligase II n=1 Tax=Knoellia remsis TaxID=407159 RepID=A0A2T0ULD1_9MICO|nr:AMP-binding protein [Knoellia remsis]PRY58730.1 acyl-CoA synthetase (AMP-forming)/AMP-acid ligase II [Knoellia remsis]
MTTVAGARDRVALVGRLRSFGDAVALTWVGGSGGLETLTYAGLAARVDARRRALGETPRLVAIEMSNDVETVVTLLACLAGGHPALCASPGGPGPAAPQEPSWWEAWDPDVVARGDALVSRRAGTAHDLHPDLALLLSTSGSTGSPKLVRLSAANVDCNAAQIVDALAITGDDVAATTLPLQYCYGLSVLLSHLSVGASVLLTDLSVVDECFWSAFVAAGGTTLAGVPYTFDLLDAAGFASRELPRLRSVTQAGGRLAPDAVRRWARLGEERGFDFTVMYGQTEATARMATLPARLASENPTSIGVAVRGGHFALAPVEDDMAADSVSPTVHLGELGTGGVGELTYEGGNVMMGYALEPADLARGAEVTTLHTGDLARFTADGLVEIVGRLGRFAKVVGLRLDLDRIERDLGDLPGLDHTAYVMDGGDRLLVTVVDATDSVVAQVRSFVSDRYAVPRAAVVVAPVAAADVPRTASGKVDRPSLTERLIALSGTTERLIALSGRTADESPMSERAGKRNKSDQNGTGVNLAEGIRGIYADVLDRPDASVDDSFVTLRGDSLSYVEASVRLEGLLGTLPPSWHVRPIRELAELAAPTAHDDAPDRAPNRLSWLRLRSLETSLVLRALAIVAIVLTHAEVIEVRGGAHVLLAVAGFAFARFQLSGESRAGRVAHVLESLTRIALPAMVWVAVLVLIDERYSWWNAALLTSVAGDDVNAQWRYWFVEAVVQILALLAVLLVIPWVDRLERARPFAVPLALAVAGLVFRFGLVPVGTHHVNGRAAMVLWLFALGWAMARASATWQRWLLTAYVLAVVPGFFGGDMEREWTIVAGLLVLTWVRAVRVPAFVVPLLVPLASASLFIYLVQWEVMGRVGYSLLGACVAVLTGWIAWRGASPIVEPVARWVGAQSSRVLSKSSRTGRGSAGSGMVTSSGGSSQLTP